MTEHSIARELAVVPSVTLARMRTSSTSGSAIVQAALILALACAGDGPSGREAVAEPVRSEDADFLDALAVAAMERLAHRVRYDGSYRTIPYPGGDVPDDVGVCTDLVIRSYRAVGVDLQQLVHEDMTAAFGVYPHRWGLTSPDPNIDHRRVPNLEVFFSRHGRRLPVADEAEAYRPGELVTWMVGPLPHIGIVSPARTADGRRPMIVHNIGRGPQLEDMLFDYPIVGHYRFTGEPGAAGLQGRPDPRHP
jgi:uncharacterized protein YijF (DUF1287 family)